MYGMYCYVWVLFVGCDWSDDLFFCIFCVESRGMWCCSGFLWLGCLCWVMCMCWGIFDICWEFDWSVVGWLDRWFGCGSRWWYYLVVLGYERELMCGCRDWGFFFSDCVERLCWFDCWVVKWVVGYCFFEEILFLFCWFIVVLDFVLLGMKCWLVYCFWWLWFEVYYLRMSRYWLFVSSFCVFLGSWNGSDWGWFECGVWV